MLRDDTIAAIATAPGNAGIGIIRISGPQAASILSQVYGWLVDGEEMIDECMSVLMRAPRSYTREDVAEIQLHGGNYVVSRALDLCLKTGARLAEAGEFTRRAFLNGRIDLSKAEAVMSLISSRSAQEHKAAVRQLHGGASSFVRQYSDELYRLQAGLAACIDYPEEISDEEGTAELKTGLIKLIHELEQAVDEHSSRLIHQGLAIALIGKPNVGKSSLLNALLGEERAIVTDIPGTTRDTVNGEMILNGIHIRLTDTAGIRKTNDPVEKLGVERSEKARIESDATLLIIDSSEPLTAEDMELLAQFDGKGAIILNKSDLPPIISEDMIHKICPEAECIAVSAKDHEKIQPLLLFLKRLAAVSDQLALTQPRHLDAVKRAVSYLKDAYRTLESYTPDLAATDLQAAQAALSEITGDNADEKLLDCVFSQFCVGK